MRAAQIVSNTAVSSAGTCPVGPESEPGDPDCTGRNGPSHTTCPRTGLVPAAERTGRGAVPRDDVAAVLLALPNTPAGGMTLELVAGDTPVGEAVGAVACV